MSLQLALIVHAQLPRIEILYHARDNTIYQSPFLLMWETRNKATRALALQSPYVYALSH